MEMGISVADYMVNFSLIS